MHLPNTELSALSWLKKTTSINSETLIRKGFNEYKFIEKNLKLLPIHTSSKNKVEDFGQYLIESSSIF